MTNDIVTQLKELAIEERPLLWRSAMFESANEIKRLREENKQAMQMAERLYDIMLAHETVSDDEWNQGIHDCWLLMTGKTDE